MGAAGHGEGAGGGREGSEDRGWVVKRSQWIYSWGGGEGAHAASDGWLQGACRTRRSGGGRDVTSREQG